ncbi:MAG: preprotein translocase subunit SecY [Bacteroidetes bacterium 47-18]|nr:MAG: preprotein translocase subunit SecY [Bacteroidetes bacterium 47-18]
MKKFLDTLKNIWSIEELRKRILLTLGLILVYRIGCYIVLPGVDPAMLDKDAAQDGLLGLINMFAGGAFSRAAIFALGVMPYISASIFMQLAGIIIPQFAKLQKEESGRQKMNQYTRYLTIIVTFAQAFAYIQFINQATNGVYAVSTPFFYISTMIILTAGTLFVMYLGERITEKGIGNGVSLLIMVGIFARLPNSLLQEWQTKVENDKVIFFIIEMAFFVLVIIGLIALTQAVRKIPLTYARKVMGNNATKELTGGSRNFIPLKLISAGVMPIIFAQALLFIPSMVAGFATDNPGANKFIQAMNDPGSLWYNLIYAFLVIAFTYFYTALTFNTNELADNLQRNNSFIPGIHSGQPTADYIGAVMDRITLPGSIFLAIAGILPGLAILAGVTRGFSDFYGGTSMLIGVGVILDTLQQIESHLLMRHYDGLMKTGRISGRTNTVNI